MTKLNDCEKVYEVLETTDYSLFSFIDSNRNISKNHVRKLKEQIEQGYELPPLIVRDTGEILDGQHRYVALVELEKPVQFMIKNDIKKDTLQKSNSIVSKWSVMDHINYHRKEGNQDYQELYDFVEYSTLPVALAARLLGKQKGRGGMSKAIERGDFYVATKEDAYQFVDEILMRIRMEHPTSKIMNSVKTIYNLGVDNKLLVNAINALEEELYMINKESKMTERIANTYNKQCAKDDKIKISYNKAGRVVVKI